MIRERASRRDVASRSRRCIEDVAQALALRGRAFPSIHHQVAPPMQVVLASDVPTKRAGAGFEVECRSGEVRAGERSAELEDLPASALHHPGPAVGGQEESLEAPFDLQPIVT